MSPLRTLLLGALALHSTTTANPNPNDQTPLTNLDDYVCTHPPYKVTMVSKSPLVIYITDFLTPSERAHLLHVTSNTFTPSNIAPASRGGDTTHIRTSHSTLVPRDPLVRCLETRALLFQGYDTPRSRLEPLQLVRYLPSQHYHYHTDWFPPHSPQQSEGGNRVSSFFAYVRVANGTTGGGTNFPRLAGVGDERWCEAGIVDCDEEWERGVTFRPVEGNAVYWENLVPGTAGEGDERTMHAGLPVVGGEKVGMNIWTREGGLGEGVRGADRYDD
ncbi:hypothetical protein QBC39DRAFT_301809 [Podospora conica]|nr:hypothetical protein QBC39DRAFT_301809 [Schizothecium conicum]